MSGVVPYVMSTIIAAFRPLLFKHYKEYMFFTIILSLFSMWIGSALYLYYEGGLKKGIYDSVKWENIKMSLFSETRFITKITSLLFLPVSVVVPLSKLSIISATFFDKIINNAKYTASKIVSIMLLILSGILIGIADYKESKSVGGMSYLLGMGLMLIGVTLAGYLLIRFQNIAKENGPGEAMMIESTGSLLLLLPALFIVKWPPWGVIVKLLIGTTFVFNIDILLKFIGLSKISAYQAIILGTIKTIIGTVLGAYIFNESMTSMKVIGLMLLIGTIGFSGSF